MLELRFTNGTHMSWNPGDDGGGSTQYLDFLKVIPSNRKFQRCLEWCAGCSVISFSLLDAGIVNELVLIDIYKPALEQALVNAKNNNFNNVTYYHSDSISIFPDTEKFDLVVSNPPHCPDDVGLQWAVENNRMREEDIPLHTRLCVDENWKAHQDFFSHITKYLNNGAELYISENNKHSQLLEYATQGGLTLIDIYGADELHKAGGGSNSVIFHFKYEEKIY